MAHRSGDSTIQVVAREIECLELCKLANLCWDWSGDVVVLQEAATGKESKGSTSSQKGKHSGNWAMTRLLSSVRRSNTHTFSRLVRFPMLGESRPERFWPGTSLPNNQTTTVRRTLVRTRMDMGKNSAVKLIWGWKQGRERREEVERLQPGDETLRRAADGGPAAGIHGILVPVLEHAMGVLEHVLDRHQSLHCTTFYISELSLPPMQEATQRRQPTVKSLVSFPFEKEPSETPI